MSAAQSDILIFDARLKEEQSYWIERLSRERGLANFNPDYERPESYSLDEDIVAVELSGALYQKLARLAGNSSFLLYTTLLAALKICLQKHSGSETIVVGSPALRELGRANALAIVDDLDGRMSFRQFALNVRETLLAAYARQRYPYSRLVKDLRLENVENRCPLFDVALALGGIHGEMPEVRNDITLTFDAAAGGLVGRIAFNDHLFRKESIERFGAHLVNVLRQALENTDAPLYALEMLTTAERRQFLAEWNDSRADYSQDWRLACLFETQVEQTPDAVAATFEGEHLTYGELNRRANRLARRLRARGVGPETLVGVCSERSLEMVVGLLGILKAGGAYAPFDPAYPQERLAFMLADAGVSLLLTQRRLAARLPELEAEAIYLDAGRQAAAGESEANPAGEIVADNLIYVIYTSGSTGRPKGVAMTHRSLANLLAWQRQSWTPPGRARTLQFASLSFDVSFQEMWATWCSGGTLVLMPEKLRGASPGLWRFITDQAIERLFLPFVALQHLAETPDGGGLLPARLREVITAGEQLQITPHIAGLFARLDGCKLHNQYGPTESHVVTAFTLVDSSSNWPALPPIGCPIANTQIHVLDSHLTLAPLGAPGELHIGGASLARGYLNRPELTAEKFAPNPLSSEPGARLYRTGDLARWLPDGNIEFLGRLDHQVKVRGYRIELGEIEAALSRQPGVRQAVVLARQDTPGPKRLVAYLTPAGEPPSLVELRAALKASLPDYMLPAAFVLLDALPLTPNGKVDRRALPAPERDRPALAEAFVAPGSPVEELLAGIWSHVLGLEQVGVRDNFFDLGGHSLLATQVMSRLRDAFQVELPLRALFESPTVAGLAGCVEAARQGEAGLPAPPLTPVSREGELPLSFAQERLWFLDQLVPGIPFYNVPAAVRLAGPLDVAALGRGLAEVVRRHEALRTTFPAAAGRPAQAIAPALAVAAPLVDLEGLGRAAGEAEVRRLALEEAQRPFDLRRGPLLRATLLRQGATQHVLLLTMHHIVSDGWSIGVLVREMAGLYRAFAAGRPSPLPELPLQYADLAHWQRRWLQGEALAEQLAYWRQQLDGAPVVLELPTDRPRPAVQTFRGAHEAVSLSRSLSEALTALSRRAGVTLFMALLAGFEVLLYRYTGQAEVLVGTPIANRNRSEVEGLIGFLVNMLVLRGRLDGGRGFVELLAQARETALGAYAHQDAPFEKVVEALQPERDLSHTPLFQVMFVLQNAPLPPLELPGLTFSPLGVESGMAQYDLALILEERWEGLRGLVEYNTDLFDAATVARMAGHFQTLLAGAVAEPERPLSALPLLTETERGQLLVEWNDSRVDYAADSCIHQWFEAQVERTPDAVAVTFEDEHLTYRGLNQQANRLAHYLQKAQVGADVLVGICVARSTAMVVGVLGILKAGGAYVPLDPTSPRERLAFTLQDAQSPVLLTQRWLVERLPAHAARVVCLDADWPVIAAESAENPANHLAPGNLAYVIYTSGSTGQPKGIPIPHRELVNGIVALVETYGLDATHRVMQFASLSFDPSVEELFSPLVSGAALVLPGAVIELVGRQLRQFCERQSITVLHLPASFWHMWVDDLASVEPPILTALRVLEVGGESPAADKLQAWARLVGPRVKFLNAYGPTEATLATSIYEVVCRAEAVQDLTRLPIGRPVANVQVCLLDAHLQPAPAGVPAELYIGGLGPGRGYLSRPDLAAGRFVPNPLGDEPGARLYRTGDLARWLPDGNLEFLGRIDYQVKIRGFRVEPGEVEAVLGQHPAVREALVIDREDAPGDRRLVAYVLAGQEPAPTAGELRSFVKARLPDYMAPSAFVLLAALPLTPGGKVDRRALPAPERDRPDLEEVFVAPRTPVEETLAGIWRQVLRLERIGVHDNFFELGGHSLLATQVVSRLRDAFRVELPLRALFESPTVAGLAAALARRLAEQESVEKIEQILAEVEQLALD